ncbi:RadC family protein [Halanaerobium sp. ST460_2HS_T2]|uniref:JAB domain-containing protein n=1 Tax=Halanaerobium sp. ST460_2HS_T2 TaxID=2183914 RepID=UPI000DF2EFD2|nr:DNA repair protein RadC [Halanaerobium sp. ST460_2HS_T2]RCW60961.1 DNA repair protein RadC [Halanaerobium sp. ST460_2HS_T2]
MLNYKDFDDQMLLGRLVSESAAVELFQDYNSLEEIILKTYSKELQRYKGIGKVKSEQIPAVAEIIRRILKAEKKNTTKIGNPLDVYNYFKEMQFLEQEEARILMLNVKSEIMSEKIVTRGTISNSLLSPREVFAPAVRSLAKAVVVVHNHPSGDPTPSFDDEKTTDKLAKAAKILEVQLVDHVIIGRDNFTSLKEKLNW